MEILAVAGIIAVTSTVATIWRVGRDVLPRGFVMVARATGSPRACVGYIQFCLKSAGPNV